jgi:hypothetical protein
MESAKFITRQGHIIPSFWLRLLSGLKWWAGCFTAFFLMLFLTAPSLFGIHFISASAVGSCFLYAMIGFVIGFRRSKH